MEFSVFECTFVLQIISQHKCSLAVVHILSERSAVRALISIQLPLFSLSLMVLSLKTDSVLPLPSASFQHSSFELSVEALFFGDDGSGAVGKVVFEESEVVEAICVVLAVPIAFGVFHFTLVEGFIGHWEEFAVGDGISVVCSQFGDGFAERSIL